MSLKEQTIILTDKDSQGNTIMQFPITKAKNIEDVMSIAQGGTGADNAENARKNLGVNDFVTGLSVSGKTITYNKKDGTSGTITTQDTVYTHPNSGVTAGTYQNVTVNAQGHVTGGSNPVKAYISETYVNGTEWYRKWSDGWVEQGGYVTATREVITVTFNKAFANTNYNAQVTARVGSNSSSPRFFVSSKTNTNMVVTFHSYPSGQQFDWYVCGKGA